MLTLMRNNKKILSVFLWIVIFAFLATIFVVWGVGDQSLSNQSYVAKIGKYTITQDEYKNAYDNALANLQAEGQRTARNDNFSREVIDNLVNRKLFLFEAMRLKIPVSDEEVRVVIEQTPAFSRNGYFSTEIYQSALQYNGITPDFYESMVRQDITIAKYLELVGGSVAVSEEEVALEYRYSFTEASFAYFTVPASKYLKELNPDEAELTVFYESVKERYREPSKIKLKYVEFNSAEFEFTPEITEEMLRNRYGTNLSDYIIPETLELYQIVAFVNDWDNESKVTAARDKMQKALDELKAGTGFDAVQKKYSEDRNNGAVGTISRSASPSELETGLFALKDGEYLGVEKTDYGFSVFKADNRTSTRLIPFEEARDALAEKTENEMRERAYREDVYASYRRILGAGNITAFEAENAGEFTVKTTDFLSENDPNAFFASDQELTTALFALGRSDISNIVDNPNASTIYEVTERIDSRIPPLSEISAAVLEDYRLDAAFKEAVEDINAKVPDSAEDKDFQNLAAEFKESITAIPPFKRIQLSPEFAWAGALSGSIFTKQAGDIIKFPEPNSLTVYVMRVSSITPPGADSGTDSGADTAAVGSYILSLKRTDAIAGAVKELRNRYGVTVNPVYLQ
jgi:peptidyl-prolyl cis-trans isomerase D